MRTRQLLTDIRYAVRILLRAPGSTASAILTLAIGIAGTTTLFSVVYGVLLRPLPYPEPDRLVQLWQYDPARPDVNIRPTPANIGDWLAQARSFADIAASGAWVGSNSWGVIGPDGNERVAATFVSASFFRVYGVHPLLGRTFEDYEDEPNHAPTVVISHQFWRSHFGGDPHVIGKTITFDSYWRRACAIVGVMPPGFDVPAHDDLWMPLGLSEVRVRRAGSSPGRCCPWYDVVARLKPGVTLAHARAEMDTIAARLAQTYPETDFGKAVKVVPLQEERVGDLRLGLLLLFGAVGCVLLIACVNVANLQLARAAARQREIAIRTALGARTRDIVRQMLVESVALGVTGGVLGTALAVWGVSAARATTASRILGGIPGPLADRFSDASGAIVSLDPVVLAFSLLLTLATGILFGLAPAWQAARVRPQHAIKQADGTSSSGRGHTRIRNALVVGEIALALVLLAGASLLVRSLLRLRHVDPGFRPEHLLIVDVDMTSTAFDGSGPSRQFFDVWKLRVSGHAGVLSVSGITSAPMTETPSGGSYSTSVTLEGQPFRSMAQTTHVDRTAIMPEYFRTLSIPLLKGREFTADDRDGRPPVAIVTKTMAMQLWPGEDPIGKRFAPMSRENIARFRDMDGREPRIPWTEVVGVVADVRQAGLASAPRPQMYVPYSQFSWHSAQLLVRTSGEPLAFASSIRADARAVNPHAIVAGVRTMDDAIDATTAAPRLGTWVAMLFAAIGALLASLGLYGVMAHGVVTRTREIGIRIALGAQRSRVLGLILRQGLALTLMGITIGAIGFTLASRVVAGVLFDTSPADPVAIAGTVALLVGVALAAAYIPARRATLVDPLVALRDE
jgi:putative ABC transport system permease protein